MTTLAFRGADLVGKIFGRPGSDQPGEVAAAGAMATKYLRDRGLAWPDVLAPRAALMHCPTCSPSPSFGWRRLALTCLKIGVEHEALTDWEKRFLDKLRYRAYPPVAKEAAIFGQIARRVGVPS